MDLNRAKVGRLVGGRLNGKVRIRSDWKEPGPADDLLIVTDNIQLTENTIFTPNPVDFRWGPHFGRGRDMVIRLLAGRPQRGMEASGMNFAGIESFELRHIERLHLDMSQAISEQETGPLSRNGPEGALQKTRLSPFPRPAAVPVEVSCQGPFHFDMVGRVATFRDRVEVRKANPTGPPDQIACELLSLYFTDRAKDKIDAKAADSLDLAAERIEARGNPVVVSAPSQRVTARAPWIQYDLASGGNGRVGRAAAKGPGTLHIDFPDRPEQPLEVAWNDTLRVFPDAQKQAISLTGGADVRFGGIGQLQAREIFFWLQRTTAFGRKPNVAIAARQPTGPKRCPPELAADFVGRRGVASVVQGGVRGQGSGVRV